MIRFDILDPPVMVAGGAAAVCLVAGVSGFLSKRTRSVLLIAAVGLSLVALAAIRVADSAYYPRVLEAVRTSPSAQRENTLALWSQFVRSNGAIGSVALHLVLWQSGYCTNLVSYSNCEALPLGSESQGIAKDELLELSRNSRGRS